MEGDALWCGVVRHGDAQHKGRRPVRVGQGPARTDLQRAHLHGHLSQRGAVHRHGQQFAGADRGAAQARRGPLRARPLDLQPVIAQRRDTVGVAELRGRCARCWLGPLRPRPAFRCRQRRARLLQRVAARRHRLRSLRQREDGAQVQRREVQHAADHVAGQTAQPARDHERRPFPGATPTATGSCRTASSI